MLHQDIAIPRIFSPPDGQLFTQGQGEGIPRRNQRRLDEGKIGSVNQSPGKFRLAQGLAQRTGLVDLGQRGNICVEPGIFAHQPGQPVRPPLAGIRGGRSDVRSHHGNAQTQRQPQSFRVAIFLSPTRKRFFPAGVRQQWQVQRHEFAIKRDQPRVAGIDFHDGRDPFHQHRPLRFDPVQALQRITPIGVHRSAEQQVGMDRDHRRNIFVGHIHLGALAVEFSLGIHHAIESQDHGFAYISAAGQGVGNPVGNPLISLCQ